MLTLNEKEMFDIVINNNIKLPDIADDPRFTPLQGDARVIRNLLFVKVGEHISHKKDTFLKIEKYRDTHKWVKIDENNNVKFITVVYRLDDEYYKHGSYSRVVLQLNNNLIDVLATFLKVSTIETIDIHHTNIWGDDADVAIPCWVKKDTVFLNKYLKS